MWRARDRTRNRGGTKSLLSVATAQLGTAPLHYWDFTANRALFNGVDVGAVTATPGYSFTRATVGSSEDLAGNIVQFSSGELRRTDKGALIEAARTNLFLNSATGSTQSITVAAVAHTLSFRGTGTITLTGVSTAGPLVGSGASTRVTLEFTPTAGSLTLTVSGSCTNVQLEEGAFVSSWIPTAGASVARNADLAVVSSPSVNYPLTMWVEYERPVASVGNVVLLRVDDNTTAERATLNISSGNVARTIVVTGGVAQADVTSLPASLVVNTVYRQAAVIATNRVRPSCAGFLGTEDTLVTLPAAPTFLRFGSELGTGQPFAYIRRAAIFNTALTDAALQRATT